MIGQDEPARRFSRRSFLRVLRDIVCLDLSRRLEHDTEKLAVGGWHLLRGIKRWQPFILYTFLAFAHIALQAHPPAPTGPML